MCCTRMSKHSGVHTDVYLRTPGGPAEGMLHGRGRAVPRRQLLRAVQAPTRLPLPAELRGLWQEQGPGLLGRAPERYFA